MRLCNAENYRRAFFTPAHSFDIGGSQLADCVDLFIAYTTIQIFSQDRSRIFFQRFQFGRRKSQQGSLNWLRQRSGQQTAQFPEFFFRPGELFVSQDRTHRTKNPADIIFSRCRCTRIQIVNIRHAGDNFSFELSGPWLIDERNRPGCNNITVADLPQTQGYFIRQKIDRQQNRVQNEKKQEQHNFSNRRVLPCNRRFGKK